MTAHSGTGRPAAGLMGRVRERSVLDQFVAGVRAGEGRALVVRGEPGVGKTALLDYLAGRATGCLVARAAGVQSEMELAFAGLHQLCAPMLDHAKSLPGPQREALRTAFGLSAGPPPDRFLVGLAVLGLLSEVAEERPLICIVDEEQRFGVQGKEATKKLKHNVDVLTLSATPIPRTLEMSLVGIRDLSLLQTPPADRQPILTYVGGYDERVAVEAIRRELLRQGQVFWVHNRVRWTESAAARLRQLVPEARIAVAHGQMDEGPLEQVVVDFWEGRYDVL